MTKKTLCASLAALGFTMSLNAAAPVPQRSAAGNSCRDQTGDDERKNYCEVREFAVRRPASP